MSSNTALMIDGMQAEDIGRRDRDHCRATSDDGHAAPFASMEAASIGHWLLWCQDHDWGRGRAGERPAWYDAGAAEMVTYTSENAGAAWAVTEARHKSPAEMKAWAGY